MNQLFSLLPLPNFFPQLALLLLFLSIATHTISTTLFIFCLCLLILTHTFGAALRLRLLNATIEIRYGYLPGFRLHISLPREDGWDFEEPRSDDFPDGNWDPPGQWEEFWQTTNATHDWYGNPLPNWAGVPPYDGPDVIQQPWPETPPTPPPEEENLPPNVDN